MYVENVLTLEHLLTVEAGNTIEMGLAFFIGSLHFVSIHLWIVHGVVPYRECCAWWTADEPIGVIRVEKFTGELAVGT